MSDTETKIDSALLSDALELITAEQMVSFILGRYSTEQIDLMALYLAKLYLEDVSWEDQDRWTRCQIWKVNAPDRYSAIYDDMATAYEELVKQACDGISPELILAALTRVQRKDS